MDKLELVKQWRRTFGLPVSETPVVLSADQLKLHAKLISDEAGEILEAINPDGTINKLKARDVSGDLLYFALGLVAEAGLDWDEEECRHRATEELSQFPDAELRCIFEDIVEVAGQLGSPDMVQETAHMLCQYAIQIDAVIGELSWLDDDFLKIHEANMAKLWTGKQVEAKFGSRIDWPGLIKNRRCVGSADGLWEASNLSGVTNAWVVRLNGKVQKPPGWKAAVLEGGAA